LKAQTYRRKAATCDRFATCAHSASDRVELHRMRDSWLALAAREDWLDGLPPLPPANAKALPHPRHA
jgi:hypothetical protein